MLAKPLRGTALLERRARRRETVAHEQREMKAAKRRDGGACRAPRCGHRDLPVDACHVRQHRGMGGNPSGSRTSRRWLVSLCRIHHGLYDAGELQIDPLTVDDMDGPCRWTLRHRDTGVFLHLGDDREAT
jgi:hypothetical protein